MTPPLIVASLFWLMVAFAATAFALDRPSHTLLRSSWKAFGIILLLTALWRVPWDGVFFHGLEYEDSYVYTVAGRQMAEHVGPPAQSPDTPFSFSVCEVGSLAACQEWEPFPEHLIGYPYVIGLASRAFRFTPSIGSIINLFASLLSVSLVFLLAVELTGTTLVALLSCLAFAVIPVFAVYGLETSAEPFSCCCLLLALWAYVRLWQSERSINQLTCWGAYTVALLFCQTVKREDALLALILPLLIPFIASKRSGALKADRMKIGMIIISSVMAFALCLKMHLFQTSENERELLLRFPLTAARLTGFIASFLSSFLVIGWYGGTFIAVLAAMVIAVRKRGLALIPVVLLLAFIILYASHIRGYYEMESGNVSAESALRFSMNLMGLWSLAVGIGLGGIVRFVQNAKAVQARPRQARLLAVALCASLLPTSAIATFYLRRDEVEDETNSRVIPALVAAEAAASDVRSSYVLTMDPLVVQMYASRDIRIVDLESIDDPTLAYLSAAGMKLVLLKQAARFQEADLSRYGEPIRHVLAMPSHPWDKGDGFTVSILQPDGKNVRP